MSEASESGQEGRRTVSERLVGGGFLEIEPDLAALYLWIVNIDESFLSLEVLDESNRGRLSGIASVGFECESKHSNTLQVICEYKDNAGRSK